jgi:ribA/ribD-fused uncharacterized protein
MPSDTPSYHPGLTPTVRGHFETEKYVFFWSGPFSNWFMGKPFTMEIDTFCHGVVEQTFNCSEQAMMYLKADLFRDQDAMAKIMKTNNARKQKELGRAVKGFVQQKWLDFCVEPFSSVLVQKFSQHADLKKIILDTKEKVIVEASPFDEVWGIKMGVNNSDILDETKWAGTNLLGICLMNARHTIRNWKVYE